MAKVEKKELIGLAKFSQKLQKEIQQIYSLGMAIEELKVKAEKIEKLRENLPIEKQAIYSKQISLLNDIVAKNENDFKKIIHEARKTLEEINKVLYTL
ncbi:MAG: hypothetical protein QXQ79_00550 [Candidatus Nanoarchaeia archaeon]